MKQKCKTIKELNEQKEQFFAPGKERVFTVGYWMSTKEVRKKRLAMWRWEEGKVEMNDLEWFMTVTAVSPAEAVQKGQILLLKELEGKEVA